MCGINGIYGNREIDKIDIRVNKMNQMIAHRGPDSYNILRINKKVVFGHRRLSIIDTHSRSDQPMISNSGRWIITYNGEIYNYKDLKQNVNYDFKTTSDTEVILAYVENYGIKEFLEYCNGMFAFALYDNFEKKLYIVRDRLGIKPIYYTVSKDCFIFSSEIKGILGSGLVKAEFNEEAIDEYLANRYVRAPFTFFENIYQLEAGSLLTIDENHEMKKSSYWQLPSEFNYEINYNEEKIVSELKSELVKSIERRLVSDVPIGTYLSGGVDSSLITAIVSNLLNKRINTYTIGFNDLNEFEYAEMVANQYNTKHHKIEMETEVYFDLMKELIYFKDAPLGVPNEVPLAYMSRVLKEKVTVVLSGEGADELLGGYGRIFRSPFDFLNNIDNRGKSFYHYFIDKYEYVPRKLRDKLLNTRKGLRNFFDDLIIKEFEQNKNDENVFRFFHKYHVKGLLQRVDTTTMLAGVEARVPFLDYKLVEFAYRNIPYDLKLKWRNIESIKQAVKLSAEDYSEKLDTPKYILKEIAKEYLPSEVIERKKVGFPVPLNNWFGLLEKYAKEILNDVFWLKKESVDELILESKKNQRAGQIVWMFINIEIFRRKYFDKSWEW
ncbi:hypothetical protein AMS60_22355 [Bacillus sp. FJAT-21945]|nr:hypothetical protein AMS60_22355 [Bacillus sp. FJAT-21945]